jgi:hypothetical protein
MIDLTTAKDEQELRDLLNSITTKEEMVASASDFYGKLAVFERSTENQGTLPDGFNAIFDHASLPLVFPYINEAPQLFWGRALNPNSDVAKAYDKTKPTIEVCRLLPVELDLANVMIQGRLSELR